MTSPASQTPIVFVTGGVVSSLGKGIAAASLAAILEARGLTVTMMKLDPYLNVDPGTMSPFQHGEVFVTDDGEAAQPTLRQDLIESWQRCRDFGLIPDARNPGVPHASEAQLSRAREQQQTLLSHARPVMQFMSEQIRESASMVILAHGSADPDARISWVYYRINSCPRLPDKRQRLF